GRKSKTKAIMSVSIPHSGLKTSEICKPKRIVIRGTTQNVGIKKAMEENVEYIMLSDQDTIYPENYINEMLKAFSYDEKVIAVVPIFIDLNTGKKSFFLKANSCFKRIYPQRGLYEIMFGIASGKIIKAEYLEYVGLMKEELFIDWVDVEWCWRAIKKGYKIIGHADVVIKHQHGESFIKFGSKLITIKKPIRQYYHVRNAFYLGLYSDTLTFRYRLIHLFKSLRYMLFYPLLVKPHLANLKYCLLGFWHGITKRLGRLE
ncbi:MAG: glycosyltransferase, partial [Thermoplasmata archaeon]